MRGQVTGFSWDRYHRLRGRASRRGDLGHRVRWAFSIFRAWRWAAAAPSFV